MENSSYPDTSALQRRARLLVKSIESAEAAGDMQALVDLRKEGGDVHAALKTQIDGVRATELIKVAMRRPRSLFEQSPGAAVRR